MRFLFGVLIVVQSICGIQLSVTSGCNPCVRVVEHGPARFLRIEIDGRSILVPQTASGCLNIYHILPFDRTVLLRAYGLPGSNTLAPFVTQLSRTACDHDSREDLVRRQEAASITEVVVVPPRNQSSRQIGDCANPAYGPFGRGCGNGICVDDVPNNNAFRCECTSGFALPNCIYPTAGGDCSTPRFGPNGFGCGDGGLCWDEVQNDGNFECFCKSGYHGPNCDRRIAPDGSSSGPPPSSAPTASGPMAPYVASPTNPIPPSSPSSSSAPAGPPSDSIWMDWSPAVGTRRFDASLTIGIFIVLPIVLLFCLLLLLILCIATGMGAVRKSDSPYAAATAASMRSSFDGPPGASSMDSLGSFRSGIGRPASASSVIPPPLGGGSGTAGRAFSGPMFASGPAGAGRGPRHTHRIGGPPASAMQGSRAGSPARSMSSWPRATSPRRAASVGGSSIGSFRSASPGRSGMRVGFQPDLPSPRAASRRRGGGVISVPAAFRVRTPASARGGRVATRPPSLWGEPWRPGDPSDLDIGGRRSGRWPLVGVEGQSDWMTWVQEEEARLAERDWELFEQAERERVEAQQSAREQRAGLLRGRSRWRGGWDVGGDEGGGRTATRSRSRSRSPSPRDGARGAKGKRSGSKAGGAGSRGASRRGASSKKAGSPRRGASSGSRGGKAAGTKRSASAASGGGGKRSASVGAKRATPKKGTGGGKSASPKKRPASAAGSRKGTVGPRKKPSSKPRRGPG